MRATRSRVAELVAGPISVHARWIRFSNRCNPVCGVFPEESPQRQRASQRSALGYSRLTAVFPGGLLLGRSSTLTRIATARLRV